MSDQNVESVFRMAFLLEGMEERDYLCLSKQKLVLDLIVEDNSLMSMINLYNESINKSDTLPPLEELSKDFYKIFNNVALKMDIKRPYANM